MNFFNWCCQIDFLACPKNVLEVEPRCTDLKLEIYFCFSHWSISCSLDLPSCTVCFHTSLFRDIAGRTWTYLLPSSTSKCLSICLKLHTYQCLRVSMLLWQLMTIILHCHFLTLIYRKSLLGIVPSAWTSLWLIHHHDGDPNHPINEEIGTTKDLALGKEIALELMWRLRGIITVLPHALIYLWVGLFFFPECTEPILNLL